MSQKDKWPGSKSADYQQRVDKAIGYLLANATKNTVSTRDDGVNICPGGGFCTGVYWDGEGEPIYTTGHVAPPIAYYGSSNPNAVATLTGPLHGMTWAQIAQGITNEFSASQNSTQDGIVDGGWRYYFGERDADMSTTQWAIIALLYDQALSAVTPTTVKEHLKVWLAAVQVSGQGGAGCYQPDPSICEQSDTGGMLLGLKLVGYDVSNSQVQLALGFLDTRWTELANRTYYGNFGHPYAMFSVYKGLETFIGLRDTTYITNLLTGDCGTGRGHPPGSGPCNWWEDYNEWLVLDQNHDGSWTGYGYWYGPLATAYDIIILGATLVPTGEPGYLEICKASDPAHPVTGLFTFTATNFGFNSGPIFVPVGQCSGSIQVPSGGVTVTETPKLGVAVSNVTAIAYDELGFQHNELNSWTLPDLHAIVNVMVGDQDEETLTTFTNYAAPPGLLKLCKVAGDRFTLGQIFTFTVTSGGQRHVYMVQAGPPQQGGYCVLAGSFPVNTLVMIAETPKPPFFPSGIAVNEGQLMPCTPPSIYCAVATVIPGITEVTFTNVLFDHAIGMVH